MVVLTKNELENGIFQTTVSIKEFGTVDLTPEQEKEKLNDFNNELVYKNIDFEKNIKVVEGIPTITEDVVDNSSVVKVGLAMNNQTYIIDENFNVSYRIDVKRILEGEKNAVLTTKELVCQAKCLVFSTCIKEELEKIVNEALTKVIGFEGEIEENIPNS